MVKSISVKFPVAPFAIINSCLMSVGFVLVLNVARYLVGVGVLVCLVGVSWCWFIWLMFCVSVREPNHFAFLFLTYLRQETRKALHDERHV